MNENKSIIKDRIAEKSELEIELRSLRQKVKNALSDAS